MNTIINIGIVGYGNLGKGVEQAVLHNPDINLKAIFTRRDINSLGTNSPVAHFSDLEKFKDKIDVMILCGGSATDLDIQGPKVAANFNTVDSFDTHNRIPEYFAKMNKVAQKADTCSLISIGWDPGLFSLHRLLGMSILPNGNEYTFWGRGVSQGHSDAIRQIKGVKQAIQYTIPKSEALAKVRSGENPDLGVEEQHIRICYVVPESKADLTKIERDIITMPGYFSGYDTTVDFISEEEFKLNHQGMPHGGIVIRTAETSPGNKQKMEFSLELTSNPEFTASVILAYARAVYKLSQDGKVGAYTIFDIPLAYLAPYPPEELRKKLL